MKLYSFIVAVRNSTIVEVYAENLEDAQESVMDKVHECGYLKDLCNPSDMEIEFDLDGEEECYRSAHTNMVGSSDDAEELCKELNVLLGRNEFGWYVNGESIGISAANLTDEDIELLNLSEDFIIN